MNIKGNIRPVEKSDDKDKIKIKTQKCGIKGFFKRDGGHSVYYDICFYPKLRSFSNWKHLRACGLSCVFKIVFI